MTATDDERQAAIRRLSVKRELRLHVVVFVLVNVMLIIIWAATGGGYFWPIWPIGGWAIGLASHTMTVLYQRPIAEADVQAEIDRHQNDATSGG